MIHWPAIIKFEGDDELTYIASAAEWEQSASLDLFNVHENDVLIDTSATVYRLQCTINRSITLTPSVERCSTDEIIGYIKAHLSSTGTCCVSKFSLDSFAEAIELVGTFSEND